MDALAPAPAPPLAQVDAAAHPIVVNQATIDLAALVMSQLDAAIDAAAAQQHQANPQAQGSTNAQAEALPTQAPTPLMHNEAEASTARVGAAVVPPLVVSQPTPGLVAYPYRKQRAFEFFVEFCSKYKNDVKMEDFDREIMPHVHTKKYAVPAAISTCFMVKDCQGRIVHSIRKQTNGTYLLELNNKKYVTAAPRAVCTLANDYIPLDYVFKMGGTNAAGLRSRLQGKEVVAAEPAHKAKPAKRALEDSELSEQPPAKQIESVPALSAPAQQEQEQAVALPIVAALPAHQPQDMVQLFGTIVTNQSKLIAAMLEQQRNFSAQLTEYHQENDQTRDKMMKLISHLAQKVGAATGDAGPSVCPEQQLELAAPPAQVQQNYLLDAWVVGDEQAE